MNFSQGSNPQFAAPPLSPLAAETAYGMDRAKAQKAIKTAWITAVVSGILTTIVAAFALSGVPELSTYEYALIDAGLIFGLAFGVFRKSRIAASMLVAYWIFNLVSTMRLSGGLLLRAVILGVFVEGVRGTFAHHKLQETTVLTSAG